MLSFICRGVIQKKYKTCSPCFYNLLAFYHEFRSLIGYATRFLFNK